MFQKCISILRFLIWNNIRKSIWKILKRYKLYDRISSNNLIEEKDKIKCFINSVVEIEIIYSDYYYLNNFSTFIQKY